jgi:hypothetical protein
VCASCPVSSQRSQRLCDGTPTSTRALFFAFFPSTRPKQL